MELHAALDDLPVDGPWLRLDCDSAEQVKQSRFVAGFQSERAKKLSLGWRITVRRDTDPCTIWMRKISREPGG